MKILIVCRWHGDHIAAFITEQAETLRALGNEVRFVMAERGGIRGYWQLLRIIRKAIAEWNPDVIHAHFGICGFVANLQRKVPVVVTYPGSDVNSNKTRPLSILSMRLSKYNLLMSKRQLEKVERYVDMSKIAIQPYGVDLKSFPPQEKKDARIKMELPLDKKLVLFSSRFVRRPEKDPELAKAVVALVDKRRREVGLSDVELLPLTGGYTKDEMASVMSAVDAALVTSKTEGSPQFTKEVMACRTPIVSVNVGDVAEQVEGLAGCYIAKTRDVEELAELLEHAIEFGKTKGREQLMSKGLTNDLVTKRINQIYKGIIAE